MSEVIDPPTYYFSGLNFNPAFYETEGITESQANALYLRKTVPDTATALETFDFGIVTPSITPTDDFTLNNPIASDLSIKTQNTTTGKIDMMTGHYSSGTVNILTGNFVTGTINLGGEDNTVNVNGMNVNIGNSTGGSITLSSDSITIGHSDTLTTMHATNIKQVIKTVSADLIENIVGDTTTVASMSTTFNRKYSSPVGGALSCYTIATVSSNQFTNQYFEIYVCGANGNRGGYAYKGCFGLERIGGGSITATTVTTLFYNGTGVNPPTSTVTPVISFSSVGDVVTLSVNTSGGGSSTQSFIATLTAYPSCSIVGSTTSLDDYIITAV